MPVENRLTRILAGALDGVAVRSNAKDADVDLLVRAGAESWIPLQVKWAGEGWPSDVRQAVERVPEPWPPNLVLLAKHFSPGALEWLHERGANWADEAGQVRVVGPEGLIVIREPARPATVGRDECDFAWSASAVSVAEAILARPAEPLRTAPLARATDWSVPQVGNLLQAFDSQGWTAKRGSARGPGAYREVTNAEGLLESWSHALSEQPRERRIAHRATRDVMSLLRDALGPALDRRVGWAASGWAGLELLAPFMTTVPTLHIYVTDRDFAGPLTAVIADVGLRELPEGGRVEFWRTDDRVFDLATREDGVPVVSAPRLYADLSALGGRGDDAAEHVQRELINRLHPLRGEDPDQERFLDR